jgi:hypothetical protein
MTRNETLLPKLSEWRPAGPGRHALAENLVDGWTVCIAADRCDELSCKVWELTVQRPAPFPDPRGAAERLATHLPALHDPLRLVEWDEHQQAAQLRSQTPTARGEAQLHHEVLIEANGRIQLRRFQVRTASGSPREQTAFVVPHENLAQLVNELTAE